MKIDNHKLVGVNFLRAGTMRAPMKPELLVIHYTATQGAASPIALFKQTKAPASAHLVIDVDGTITQMVEFNVRAAHAGISSWKGRESCNGFSIGIEIVNPGPIVERNGVMCDTTSKKPFPGAVIEARHKNANCPFPRWAAYPEPQMSAVIAVSRAICQAYGIKVAVGHEDISPGRKIDPGPAFDWARFRAEVFA